jgi:hypothetical protein
MKKPKAPPKKRMPLPKRGSRTTKHMAHTRAIQCGLFHVYAKIILMATGPK